MEVSLKAFSSNIVQLSISSVALLMRSQATFFFKTFFLYKKLHFEYNTLGRDTIIQYNIQVDTVTR